jgi:NAD(P)-dependent dehydrogenase (short-subunit alcohol dehydrogenase family)
MSTSQTAAARPARSILVTGASKGLGKSFASAWAHHGAAVLINNRFSGTGPSPVDDLVAQLAAKGLTAAADHHAVQEPGAATTMVDAAVSRFGGLDALILSAAIEGPAEKIGTDGDGNLDEVMAINFFANAAIVRAALPHLAQSDSPRILFISSTAGVYGVKGRSAYAASKGAINGYALSLAQEQRRNGVLVNILMPYAATTMTTRTNSAPDTRLMPDDIAAAALWLSGPDCTETGSMWVAAGQFIKRVVPVESAMAGPHGNAPEWLAERSAEIGPDERTRGYPSAEHAFAAFYAELSQHPAS